MKKAVTLGRKLQVPTVSVAKYSGAVVPTYDHITPGQWSFRGGRNSVSGVVATVFGASGFLGPYVVNSLASTGTQCIIPIRGEENAGLGIARLKVLGEPGQILPVRWHLRNQESIEFAAAPANVVIDLVGKWWATRNFTTVEANLESADAIAKASKHAERFIFVSAIGADSRSKSEFYRLKAEAEKVVRATIPNATIIRTSRMYGDEDCYITKYASIARRHRFCVSFHEDTPLQPVFVGDVARAIQKCLLDPSTKGQTYEVAGPRVMTHHELKELLWGQLMAHPITLPVPPALMEYAASWLEMAFHPTFHRDEIVRFGIPDVRTGKYPDLFKVLGMEPRALEDLAISSIRHYRRPHLQGELY